jgi:hypothetical protein
VVISYHTYETYQTPIAVEREQYYATGLITPFVVFDGTNSVFETNFQAYVTRYKQAYDVARSVAPLFNLEIISASASATAGSIELRVITADTIPGDDIMLFASILEDSLPGAYTTFTSVCRDLLGFTVQMAYPDTLDTTITFSHAIPVHLMTTVVFVQDVGTKEVLGATRSIFVEE